MQHTTTPVPSPPFGDDDPRAVFARAVALAGAVIEGVPPAALDAPTPCDRLSVRDLLGHLVAVLRRVAALGRGENPMAVPFAVDGVADGGWLDAWREAAHEVQAAWTDDARLRASYHLPWADLDGAGVLATYTSEITTHTWDLATATGQTPAWDDRVVTVALAVMRDTLPAGPARRERFARIAAAIGYDGPPPFGEAVDVPADAPLIAQLVAWTGRRP